MDAREYEILFDLPAGEYDQRAVGGIRTRTTRAGDALVVECYPITRIAYHSQSLRLMVLSIASSLSIPGKKFMPVVDSASSMVTANDWIGSPEF